MFPANFSVFKHKQFTIYFACEQCLIAFLRVVCWRGVERYYSRIFTIILQRAPYGLQTIHASVTILWTSPYNDFPDPRVIRTSSCTTQKLIEAIAWLLINITRQRNVLSWDVANERWEENATVRCEFESKQTVAGENTNDPKKMFVEFLWVGQFICRCVFVCVLYEITGNMYESGPISSTS